MASSTARSSVPCVLSFVFGIISFYLSVIAFYMYFAAAMSCESYGAEAMPYIIKTAYFQIAVVLSGTVVILWIAGMILGITGIAQRRKMRGFAIAGVSIISLIISGVIFQCWFLNLISSPG